MIRVLKPDEIDLSDTALRTGDFEITAYIQCDNKPVEAFCYKRPNGFYYEVMTLGVVTESFAANANFSEEQLLKQCLDSLEGRKMPIAPEEW